MLKDKWVITTTLAISLVLAGCSTGDAANTESSEGTATSSTTNAAEQVITITNTGDLASLDNASLSRQLQLGGARERKRRSLPRR